jgi:hypothetical protein
LEPSPSEQQDWWRDVTRSDCESVRKRHERIDVGEFNGCALRLTCDLVRINWSVGAAVKLEDDVEWRPTVGPFEQTMKWFSPLMENWLSESCPPIRRLAFIGKIARWTPNMAAANHLLSQLLPSLPIGEDAIDVQYRINRQRHSASCLGLTLNRLSTWTPFRFDTQLEVMGSPGRSVKSEFFGCMLILDMSTDADKKDELAKDVLVPLWRELVSLGSEIAHRGDVK